jgi:hypothetical protein
VSHQHRHVKQRTEQKIPDTAPHNPPLNTPEPLVLIFASKHFKFPPRRTSRANNDLWVFYGQICSWRK